MLLAHSETSSSSPPAHRPLDIAKRTFTDVMVYDEAADALAFVKAPSHPAGPTVG